MTQPFLKYAALLGALSLAGCTMKSQEAPSLSGPSEYGTSIAIALSPDVLTQDGASQSLITITARDGNGDVLRNVSLRASIMVDGVNADFGSLSARNMVTGNDGRATVVYTAPGSPAIGVDTGTIVTIQITPVGSDFNNTAIRTAAIRLVPPGIIIPPDGLRPDFTFTPQSPTDHQTVLFDAGASTSGSGNPISRYNWNFGDGDTASGRTASHAYDSAGSYVVTLTITDVVGRSASKTSNILVGAGLDPTAVFTASPTEALVGQAVNFNASASRAAPGFSIVSYEWSFGDGTTGQGPTTSHAYSVPGTYIATLNVTDNAGHDGTSTQTVTVGGGAGPETEFTFSPAAPVVNETVNFNASSSRAPAGATIQSYVWNFGDGTTGQGQTTTHAYKAIGTYSVTLTTVDSTGRSSTSTETVPVGAGADPTAAFTFSPTNPVVGQEVNVNASASRPSPGASITKYFWNFGDGASTDSGPIATTTHTYKTTGSFIITLTVTDSSGHTATASQAVTVGGVNPTADFTISPTDPTTATTVTFNGSTSRAVAGQSISEWTWNFGDANAVVPDPNIKTGPNVTHRYTAAGTYVIVLTVRDTAGNVATTSKSVTVTVPK